MNPVRSETAARTSSMSPEQARELRWARLKVRGASMAQIEAVRERLAAARAGGDEREVRILNVMLVMSLFVYELAASIDDFVEHGEGLRSRLYARQIVVQVHETGSLLTALLGERFQTELREAGFSRLWIDSARRAHEGLAAALGRTRPLYEGLGRGSEGPREGSGEEQLRRLEGLEAGDAARVAILALEAAKDLAALLVQHGRGPAAGGRARR